MAKDPGLEQLRGRQPWTEQQAGRVLDRLRASGAPVSTFAARVGISAQRIYWWRARLGSRPESAPPTQLVPVAVRLPVDQPSGAAAAIEVFDQQLRIEVRALDAESARWLAEVVRALRATA